MVIQRHPSPHPAPESIVERAGSREDGDEHRPSIVAIDELEVVDLARRPPIAVDHLAIEELQLRLDPRRKVGGHAPALVTIMSGMVITDTMRSSTR